MAVTKTHPIKSTLKAAIDYICNPEKTDGKLLVSSYGCAAETADIEFAWTRRHAIDKGTNLGRHLIQAFQPGEVTPEQAHEIGMELAKEILGGKYEFVLTTHIDKDHVHNHLIFNAVSFADHKHYHSNKRSYHYIRRTSDRLCKEHGLSVIIPGQDKGKSYIEHQAAQNGTSYKAKLKAAIDRLLPACSDLEELLRRLQREGYEIKRGNEVPTTDIRKPFFFIGRYYFFTISFFFIILVVMVVREGKVPQYQGFRDFCPTTRPTTGSTTEATTGFYFCFNHSSGSPNCSISSVGIS